MKPKMGYRELHPVIAINILNFSMFDQTNRFHTTYHLYEDQEKFQLTDVMEFHFIEMPKLLRDWKNDKLDPWDDVLARWLLLLGIVDRRDDKVYEDIFTKGRQTKIAASCGNVCMTRVVQARGNRYE